MSRQKVPACFELTRYILKITREKKKRRQKGVIKRRSGTAALLAQKTEMSVHTKNLKQTERERGREGGSFV